MRKMLAAAAAAIGLVACVTSAAGAGEVRSAFYPPEVLARVREAAGRDTWGRGIRDRAVEMARPWREMSDDKLWGLMFSANLPRSWMVWSNGYCPSCKKPVPMYNWKIDAIGHPWKVQCPECGEFFPKNDFGKYYESGLDGQGLFDPKKADRSLLLNVDHPDAKDPLHQFGVDDSSGFVEGDKRWRFIQAYLIFGQWKQAVLGGIKALSTAYVLTGDQVYAHKAGVLLHRVSTLYPSFDFEKQGVVYEVPSGEGYVSIWHDACVETRELAICYDAVKEAVAGDAGLAKFLNGKPGARSPDVIAHIDAGILKDPFVHPERIYSNYPQQALTMAVIKTAEGWPGNRGEVLGMLKPVLDQATAVDGVTGEKGLANYSAYAAQQIALFFGYYTRADAHFLADVVKQNPRLPEMWRFFVLTRCLDRYYPLSGDTGWFAGPQEEYVGVMFSKEHFLGSAQHSNAVLPPSMYSFLFDLYKLTGDAAFVQTLVRGGGAEGAGLPYDLFARDAKGMREEVANVIAEKGERAKLGSVNFPNWHLAILRSGEGKDARAVWLDYDSWGGHGHADGMNLGLFACGLDLAPDFGYPPVQYGGWESPRANWYRGTAAHNTVMVDWANQPQAAGTCTFFDSGEGFAAVSASAPGMVPGAGTEYARTVALVDASPERSYVVDVFHVVGGTNHAKGFSSHFSTLTTSADARMSPADDLHHPQMRNFRVARGAATGWAADFKIEDRYKLLKGEHDVHLRCVDLTRDADAYAGEAWVVQGSYSSTEEAWIPRLITSRRVGKGEKGPLASTFVSVMEASDGKPVMKGAGRLALATADGKDAGDAAVGIRVDLEGGERDYVVSLPAGSKMVRAGEAGVETDATLAVARVGPDGKLRRLAVHGGTRFTRGGVDLALDKEAGFVQMTFDADGTVRVVARGPNRSSGGAAGGK